MAFKVNPHWHIHDAAGRRKYTNASDRAAFLAQVRRFPPSLRAICYLLDITGCRVSEALALGPEQLDADSQTLVMPTLKRRRVAFRTIPLPGELVELLLSLPRREDGRFWGMHRVTVWRWVRRAMHRAGIHGPMACCKGLRHGFGVRAALKSIPINFIQRWMGHASPTTTAIYMEAVGPEERQLAARMW